MKLIYSILFFMVVSFAAQANSNSVLLFSHFAIATTQLESKVNLLKELGFEMIDSDFTTTWDKPWGDLVDGLYGKDSNGQTKRVRYARMLWPSEGAEFWQLASSIIRDDTIPPRFQQLFVKFPEFHRIFGGQSSTLTKTLKEMCASLKGGQLGIEVFEVADSVGNIEAYSQPLLHYAFVVDKDDTVLDVFSRLSSMGWETVFPSKVKADTETIFMKMPGYEKDFGKGMGIIEIRKNPWPQPAIQDVGK